MIALAQPDDPRRRKPGPRRRKPAWHRRLSAMLPTIRSNAKLAFRHWTPKAAKMPSQRSLPTWPRPSPAW